MTPSITSETRSFQTASFLSFAGLFPCHPSWLSVQILMTCHSCGLTLLVFLELLRLTFPELGRPLAGAGLGSGVRRGCTLSATTPSR